jgi:hypothetical protein
MTVEQKLASAVFVLGLKSYNYLVVKLTLCNNNVTIRAVQQQGAKP